MSGFKNIKSEPFKEGLENDDQAELLDVRTPGEYEDAHIPGARLINILGPDFTEQIEQLDKDKAYYVYCRSGSRSASACQYMASIGFRELYNLEEGIIGWKFETNANT